MEQLRKKIYQAVNEAQLPPDAIFYIIKDIYRDMCEIYQNYLINKEQTLNNNESENEKNNIMEGD